MQWLLRHREGARPALRWLATACGVAAVVVALGLRLGPGPALAEDAARDQAFAEIEALVNGLGMPFRAAPFGPFVVISDLPSDALELHGATLVEAARDFDVALDRLGIQAPPATGPLVVLIFAEHREFLEFAARHDAVDAHWMGGYFSPGAERIALYDDRRSPAFVAAARDSTCSASVLEQAEVATRLKLRHEAAHLLAFARGIQPAHGAEPLWLVEGFAESFARGALSGSLTPPTPEAHETDPVRAFYERSRAAVDAMVLADPLRLGAMLRSGRDIGPSGDIAAVSTVTPSAKLDPTPP